MTAELADLVDVESADVLGRASIVWVINRPRPGDTTRDPSRPTEYRLAVEGCADDPQFLATELRKVADALETRGLTRYRVPSSGASSASSGGTNVPIDVLELEDQAPGFWRQLLELEDQAPGFWRQLEDRKHNGGRPDGE